MRGMRALRFAGAVALACFAALGSAFGGCGGDAFTAGSGNGDGSAVDRQGDDGSGSGGGDGAKGDGANDGPTIIPGQTVYVSTSGHDTSSGLDPQHPVHSVKQGLKVAQTLSEAGVMVPKVLVCVGDYFENSLQVTFDVGLFGGWDCTTDPNNWARGTCLPAPSPSPYCFPTFAKGTTSNIEFANVGLQQATLFVQGSVTSATQIDGFTITGAASGQGGANGSVGIDVAAGTTPKLSNIAADGGGGVFTGTPGPVGGIGSIAMRISESAAPEVAYSSFVGGTGRGPNGSVGILVNTKGAPVFVGDIVSGGSGSAANPSTDNAAIGMDVLTSLSGSTAPQLLIVYGSDPTATPNGNTIGVRMRAAATALDLTDCVVSGGSGTAGTGVAIQLEVPGTVNLVSDRIWGGQRSSSQTYGVRASGATSVTIVDSEIHAGDVTMSSVGTAPVAVELGSTVTEAQLVFDTIYTGQTTGSTAVNVEQGAKGVTIEDDLILGDGTGTGMGTGDVAVIAASCSGQIAKLDYTGFVNSDTLLKCTDATSGNAVLASTPTGITSAIEGVVVQCSTTCGDVLVYNPASATVCSTEKWCVDDASCPNAPGTCLPSLLGTSWTSAYDGAESLSVFGNPDGGAATTAWQIEAPANYCALTTGGVANALATKDLLGATRASKPTMGAVEYMGSCH